jgi:hypothetical protein
MTIPEPNQQHIRILENPDEMTAEVLSFVPIGTSLQAARNTMERNGFTCSLSRDEDSPRDFLYCDIKAPWKAPVVLRSQVQITCDQSGVTGVAISSGFIGP